MDSEKLKSIREKCWDVDYILDFQKGFFSVKWHTQDIINLMNNGLKTIAIVGAAYMGYKAVKYYADRKFKED